MRACLWIVIVNFRTPDLAVDCLRSLIPQVDALNNGRVVVIDNHSGDDSVAKIQSAIAQNGWSTWAEIMSLDRNGSFAFGNNAGIRAALASPDCVDYVMLLNADTIARNGAIKALVDFMASHPRAGMAGSLLETVDGGVDCSTHRIHSALSELDSGTRLGLLSRLLHRFAVSDHLRSEAHQCDWVFGASLIMRRPVLEDIGLMNTIQQPVFLVGAERSGSTLLRLMLDHHPEIAFNLESEFMVTQISDDGVYPEIRAYREWLIQNRVFKHSHFVVNEHLSFIELLNDFLVQKITRDAKRFVGATVHYQFSKLRMVWPNAKFIYLFRDGRDVARSVVQMGWAGNTYVAADWWMDAEREWDMLRQQLPTDRWIEIRHEDLIRDTQAVLTKICKFIGTVYDERMFDYTKKSAYGLPDSRLSNQWRNKMKPKELRRVEAKLGELLARRGYSLSGLPPLPMPAPQEKLAYLQSRWATFSHGVEKFGLGLILQEIISRQLGRPEWHKAVVSKIDQAIDQTLR